MSEGHDARSERPEQGHWAHPEQIAPLRPVGGNSLIARKGYSHALRLSPTAGPPLPSRSSAGVASRCSEDRVELGAGAGGELPHIFFEQLGAFVAEEMREFLPLFR